ncbi:MAG: hypothetical protein ACETVW_00845 [Dehalococcoidia bacterium]
MNKRLIAVLVIVLLLPVIASIQMAQPIEETNEKSPDQTEPLDAAFVEKVRTSDFILSVKVPEEVKAGEEFRVEGMLKYIGEEEIRLFHGVPVIRFAIFDEDGKFVDDLRDHPRVYVDIGVITPLEPGQKMKVEDTWKIDYPGQYELTAKTTILANKDPWEELFEGKNYERFIRDDMSERVKELTKSKIATDPIEITVING